MLKIDNEKQLKKFYRYLFIYRSFLFRFIKFKLEEDKYEVSEIIKALNVKGRKKRITYIYDKACEEIDEFFEGKNVCDFKDGKCLSQQKNNSDKFNGCCRLCEHRTGGLCPSRNLACKLFYCSYVTDKYEILNYEDIKVLKCLTPLQRFVVESDYFSLEKDVINDLYFGVFLATFRVCYRHGKHVIRNRFNWVKSKLSKNS